jgi:lipoate-protein ligase B
MALASSVVTVQLGLVDYQDCLRQQLLFSSRARQESTAFLLVVEHPPVITLGKNADKSFIVRDPALLGAAIVQTDRGGEVTAHMPGQLVIYPIVPLTVFRLMPKQYINLIEQAVVRYLKDLGIPAEVKEEYPGIWVGNIKVCAVGVRVENRVTRHGLALNINNDLELFAAIVPCGISHLGVGRVRDLVDQGSCPTVEEASKAITTDLTRALIASITIQT